MNSQFYSRLAISNIRKNRSIYLPYLLAGALMAGLFYSLVSVGQMVLTSDMEGGGTMGYILAASSVVCGLLSFVVLFYINSFIMKRRKKEFGLYSILGMEKRHIARVMAWEVLFSAAVSIAGGIVGGALFSQLFFLLLQQLLGLPVRLTFQLPLGAALASLLLFGAGYLVVLFYGIASVRRSDPIALLHSAREGEREPRSRWFLAILGAAALGGGYYLSWTVRVPSDAISVFFPAVLLVILGTYCLFLAGSIVLLKLLRRNKHFYYKPRNFVSVSGMLYRMKQNAAGLANICILSTCVLVTLSSTVCLFLGEEDILRERLPRQVKTGCVAEDGQSGAMLESAALGHAQNYGMTIENGVGYHLFSFPTLREKNSFAATDSYGGGVWETDALLLEDYRRNTGEEQALADGELLLAVSGPPVEGDTLTLAGREYRIAGRIGYPDFVETIGNANGILVVLPAFSHLEELAGRINGQLQSTRNILYSYNHDVAGNPDALPDYYAAMLEALNQGVKRLYLVDNIDSARASFYELYGSLMFVGIFFIALFLIAAVLIIYYKQITEGFDDRDRFQIMENVGMSDQEVRGTISKQMLLMFYLPLGGAVLHIAAAFPVLATLLQGFAMYNTTLFLLCTLGAVLLFSALYLVVYRMTARTYYRIVQTK